MRLSILLCLMLCTLCLAAEEVRERVRAPLAPFKMGSRAVKRQTSDGDDLIDISGPPVRCEDNVLCPCGTADICCASGYQCCGTGHSEPTEAEALGFKSGDASCLPEDVQNLRANGFSRGSACAPPGGVCCKEGHACDEGQVCCHTACVPANTVCCAPTEDGGTFGYCRDGLMCTEDNNFCVVSDRDENDGGALADNVWRSLLAALLGVLVLTIVGFP